MLAIFLLVALSFTSCTKDAPLLIGFLAGTSGRVADSGISARDAAQLAVEQCNQTGGILGRKVRLVIKDDQQKPEIAQKCAQELIREGVVAVIGPMTSNIAKAIAPIANEAKVVFMSPTATTELLSGRDDYFFRVASTSGLFAARSAHYLTQFDVMLRVAVAYDQDNASFSENWVDNFRRSFSRKGGVVISSVGFRAGDDRTFLDIARSLLTAEPDGIVIVANSFDAALLCQQIRKIDSQMKIFLSDWSATERLLEMGGKAVEGVIVIQAFDRASQAPRYQTFRRAYLSRFQREPGFPGVNTYDAIQVMLKALRTTRIGQDLKDTILSLGRFQGLQCDFRFDRFGDVQKDLASISIVKNGQFVVLE